MICHQRIVRDKFEPELRSTHPQLFDRGIKEFSLSQEKFTKEHREFIERFEWLGTVGNSPVSTFAARLDGVLAGVVLFGRAAGRTPFLAIQRGANAPFAHQHLSSRLIGFSLRALKKEGKWDAVIGYSDPRAGEIGTIYSACNFQYMGDSFGAKAMYVNTAFRAIPFSPASLRRTSILKRWYKQTYGVRLPETWLKPNGFKDVTLVPRPILQEWYAWGDKIIAEASKEEIPLKSKWVFHLKKVNVPVKHPKRVS